MTRRRQRCRRGDLPSAANCALLPTIAHSQLNGQNFSTMYYIGYCYRAASPGTDCMPTRAPAT